MGYLTDNTPSTKNWIFCQELYPYRIIIVPEFSSDSELQTLVRGVIPDVEQWQFSGRRRCPRPRFGKPINPIVHPYAYAQNAKRRRQFDERVVFAFNTTTNRDKVAARLNSGGFTFSFQDEPTRPINDQTIIVLVP